MTSGLFFSGERNAVSPTRTWGPYVTNSTGQRLACLWAVKESITMFTKLIQRNIGVTDLNTFFNRFYMFYFNIHWFFYYKRSQFCNIHFKPQGIFIWRRAVTFTSVGWEIIILNKRLKRKNLARELFSHLVKKNVKSHWQWDLFPRFPIRPSIIPVQRVSLISFAHRKTCQSTTVIF